MTNCLVDAKPQEKARRLYLQAREQGIKLDPTTSAYCIQAAGNYAEIRQVYYTTFVENIISYLTGEGGRVEKNTLKRTVVNGFADAFETGWMDGVKDPEGGYTPDSSDEEWLTARISQELAYVDSLFISLKAMKDDAVEPLTLSEIDAEAESRAAGYAATLDGVYGQGKLVSRKAMMLTLDGPDGQESCKTCQKYKLQRHRASWWISHDLVPAPGNNNYDCKGYRCQHILSDDDGNQWAGAQA